jgi:putative DNA-invertase from lambdoid prophage Rac
MRHGVIVRTVIHNTTVDGSAKDPMLMAVRDALIGFMAATAQAQAAATQSGAAGRNRTRQGQRRQSVSRT